jgi:transcriptional regulator with XRE-family HTH domain
MDLKKQIAARIRTIRTARDLSQDDLAAMIGRSVDAISNIERGKNLPSLETLVALAEGLKLSLVDVVGNWPAMTKISAKRVAAEAELIEIARQLSDQQLAIAIKQLHALKEGT